MGVGTADRASAPPARPVTLSGWGGGHGVCARVIRPRDAQALAAVARAASGQVASGGAIARGMGRSYGDAAQLRDGLVIETTALKQIELDRARGTVTAAAGVTIEELLDAVVPHGWIVPVVPGTQHVSVGGAIASDIHGKNHGAVGTFGSHVQAIGLLRADGELVELAPPQPAFQATVGGMGLTGVIVWARIALRAVSSPALAVDTDRADSLDDVLSLLSESGGPHRVAWLDLLGSRAGRGVVTRAEHVDASAVPADSVATKATVRPRATVPARWPGIVLRPLTVRAFNELRFRSSPRRQRGHVEPFGAHMFPLDVLRAWPRLYGRHGLVQYQLVVPPGREIVLEQAIEQLRVARVPCYLAVLKDFGPANAAPLSFPIKGWTLALDLPRAAPGLDRVLDQLDELVAGAGGRVYLTKDSRLRPDTVRAMYPRLAEWRAARDELDPHGLWRSDLSRRTGLTSR